LKLTVHPAADIFPMMSPGELGELADSIKKNGLRERLTVTTDGVLLDGRNRYAAMQLAEIGLTDRHVEIIDFDTVPYSEEEYVEMANIERRNLTREQRRELSGKLAVMMAEKQKHLPKEEQTDTTAAAAEKAGVSRRTAATAKQEAYVALGLRKPPTAVPPPKKPAKSAQAPARPPAVVKALQNARDNIYITYAKWPMDRKKQAVAYALDIIRQFPDAEKEVKAGQPDKDTKKIVEIVK
jgi:hypothetical protein